MIKYLYLLLVVFIFSCSKENDYELVDTPMYKKGEEFPIGTFTVSYSNKEAFGQPLVGISDENHKLFTIGNIFFNKAYYEDFGLGPLLNAKSCNGCHSRDGRGRPDTSNTNGSFGFLMRVSTGNNPHTGPIADDIYGDQLQDKTVAGTSAVLGTIIDPEATISIGADIIYGKYPDGSKYELRKPKYTITWHKGAKSSNLLMSPRVGTQTIGLGFIDALSEKELLKNADENDADGDGISGKANYVWNVKERKNTIGKFGWKANAPTLEQQIAGAFSGDMGMTTSLFPDQNNPIQQPDISNYFDNLVSGKGIGDIEVDDKLLRKVTMYQAILAVPKRRNYKDQNVLEGKVLFNTLACIKCHVTDLKVGKSEMLPIINGTVISPYSDFLLHDMGEDLADNRGDFLANGKEWRTMPLWGIGLIYTVNGHEKLLHDGRADGIEEAILWHGGEALQSKNDFKNLVKEDRQKVIDFVNSL